MNIILQELPKIMNVLTYAYANKYTEDTSFNSSMSLEMNCEIFSNLEVMTANENTSVTQQETESK